MNLLYILLRDNPLPRPVPDQVKVSARVSNSSSERVLLLLLVPLPYNCASVSGAHEPLADGVDAVADVFVCFGPAKPHVGVVVWIQRLTDHILSFVTGVSGACDSEGHEGRHVPDSAAGGRSRARRCSIRPYPRGLLSFYLVAARLGFLEYDVLQLKGASSISHACQRVASAS